MTPQESRAWRPEISGWSEDILPFLRDFLVPRLPPAPACALIGIFEGRDLAFLMEELVRQGKDQNAGGNAAKVLGVDIFTPDPSERYPNGDAVHLVPGAMVSDRFLLWKIEGRFGLGDVVLAGQGSKNAMGAALDRSLDSVFLDGDHREAPFRADVEGWLPKLKPGGWLCGHDYGHPQFPGVKRVVDSLRDRQEVLLFDSVWAWHPSYGAALRLWTPESSAETAPPAPVPFRRAGRRTPPPAPVAACSRGVGGHNPRSQELPQSVRRR